MATNANLAARLLRDAATFFRSIGQDNPELEAKLAEHAAVFEHAAGLVEDDPMGTYDEDDDNDEFVAPIRS
jgi:hypothetical protein